MVITADHKLPSDESIKTDYDYSEYCPLIIYSPNIVEKTIDTDTY